jgi:tRNA (guanine-N7-)-methyltransferase
LIDSNHIVAAGKQLKMSKAGYNFPLKVRAHTNPLADERYEVPESPVAFAAQCATTMYPGLTHPRVTLCDVGCAWGGMIMRLAPLFPQEVLLGIEIRLRVAEYTQGRIEQARTENPGMYQNVMAMRSNGMRFLPYYFEKGQLNRIFFIHPDPHFKKANYRKRIISYELLSDYAYVLREGGILHTVTDVLELHEWMVEHLSKHPLFDRLSEEECAKDEFLPHIRHSSEDGQKVAKSKTLQSYYAIWRRRPDPVFDSSKPAVIDWDAPAL